MLQYPCGSPPFAVAADKALRYAVTGIDGCLSIPRERIGGVYAALAGNLSRGGDVHNTSRFVLGCFYRLDRCPGMGQVQRKKEVSRLRQQATHD